MCFNGAQGSKDPLKTNSEVVLALDDNVVVGVHSKKTALVSRLI